MPRYQMFSKPVLEIGRWILKAHELLNYLIEFSIFSDVWVIEINTLSYMYIANAWVRAPSAMDGILLLSFATLADNESTFNMYNFRRKQNKFRFPYHEENINMNTKNEWNRVIIF